MLKAQMQVLIKFDVNNYVGDSSVSKCSSSQYQTFKLARKRQQQQHLVEAVSIGERISFLVSTL